jgi:hypothetical protein
MEEWIRHHSKTYGFGDSKRTDLFLLITRRNLGKFLVMLRTRLIVRTGKRVAKKVHLEGHCCGSIGGMLHISKGIEV